MKKVFLLLLMLTGLLYGQTWIHYYLWSDLCPGHYDSADAEVCNVIPAIGGGYLLQGYVQFGWGDIPAYDTNVFWKLDENGDIVWRKTGGASGAFNSIVSNGVDRYYCLRTDSGYSTLYIFDNELNWLGYYHNYTVSLYDMQYVDDGLVFAGRVGNQGIILKTDFQFNTIWQSESFMTIGSEMKSVEAYENEWIGISSRWFANYTSIGDTVWTHIDTVNLAHLFDCTVTMDGTVYILVLDAIGYKIVRVNMINRSFDDVANIGPFELLRPNQSISGLPNGNIVYLGSETNNQLLHCYSPDGAHQWSRSYNTLGAIYFGTGSKNLLVMPDGSILFCMHDGSMVLIKTDAGGNVANNDPIAPVPEASIRAYPQPASSKVMISVKSEVDADLSYSIYNIRGQKTYSGKIIGHNKEQSFELPTETLERMSSGVYIISLDKGNSKLASTKLVVVH